MRRRVIGGAIVVVAILGLAWLISGPLDGGSLGPFTPPANADTRPLGEIGPGACWPEDQRPSGGTAVGFAHENGAKEAADWFRVPENKAVAERQDRWYNTRKDYYLVYEVVPEWDQLDPVERVARYTEQLSVVKLEKPIYVYNTHCKNGEVEAWEPQVLPEGEWVGFVRGHEPGKPDMRPAKKMVCGNDLFQVPPPSPEQSATVPPGPPGCEGSSCIPTTPQCEGPCTTTTTKPPGCAPPCDNEQKIPEQGSDPKGNAPVGGGTKDQPGTDVRQPHTPNPTTPYTAPTQPTQAGPPPGSIPTQVQPPPVETSVNPPSSQPNQGDPGEW